VAVAMMLIRQVRMLVLDRDMDVPVRVLSGF
jgi:hypothetical protein